MEIIGRGVDNNSLADDLRNGETIGEKNGDSATACTEKRRQITCMIGMGTIQGIKMPICISKRIISITAAALAAVNMKSEYRLMALAASRESTYFCPHHNTAFHRIESDYSVDVWIISASVYNCHRIGQPGK